MLDMVLVIDYICASSTTLSEREMIRGISFTATFYGRLADINASTHADYHTFIVAAFG